MDMMLQLMARKIGINSEDLYVSLVQEVVVSLGGIETRIEPPIYDVGDVVVSEKLVETCVQSQETTYEALSGDGAAAIVELGEHEDTIISTATSMSVEPSNEEFGSMHGVVDVCSNDSALVISSEVSNIVIDSYYTIDQQSVDVHFWDSTMFNMDATLSYNNVMFEVDVDHSPKWSWAQFSPSTKIQFCVAAIGNTRFHRSSMELPSSDIQTST